MTWLIFIMALEAGIVPESGWVMREQSYVHPDPLVYTQFEFEAEAWETLFVGGSIKTVAQKAEYGWTFAPNYDRYVFTAGVRAGQLELGWRHMCMHPVFAYIGQRPRETVDLEGAYDEFYIRIEGRLGAR